MRKNPTSQSGIFNPRVLVAFTLCSIGVLLAMLSFAATPPRSTDKHAVLLSGSGNATGTSAPLAPATAGSWDIVSSPNTSSTQNNFLASVACASAADCWAGGFYYDNNKSVKTLIEHKTDSGWSIEPAPTPTNGLQDLLTAITCVSATDCWTVGYYDNNGLTVVDTVDTLTEHFDGSNWTVVSSPNGQTGTRDSRLWSVSCPAANDCWPVGEYSAPGVFSLNPSSVWQTLIERWDGTSWTIVTSPNALTAADNFLNGVTCVSASEWRDNSAR